MAPQPGDIYELTEPRKKFNRFITLEGVIQRCEHIVYIWVLEARRPSIAQIRTASSKDRIKNFTVLRIYKPKIFPEGCLVEGPFNINARQLGRAIKPGFRKLKPQKWTTLNKASLARFYRKIGALSSRSRQLGL